MSSSASTNARQDAQARMVLRLMDRWQLSSEQRASLVAMDATEESQQALFTQLLDIHKLLRVLFPANRELAYRWMTSRNKQFDGCPPIDLLLRDGIKGLEAVGTYLRDFVQG